MATSITVAQAINYEQNQSSIPAGAIFDIVDVAANIETLTASEISQLSSLLNVSSITSTDAPVTFTPGGPEQAALHSAGISITAEINVAETLYLESPASGPTLLVPPDEHIVVLDTAADLHTLTVSQIDALSTIADKLKANGTDSGHSAVTQIAGTDAPPVFTANQVAAVGNNGLIVVAPPNDPSQNDGTVTIHGRGMTFVITWDPSVASAPDAFKLDVEKVAQFFADTYSSPATFYFNVGYGEINGSPVASGDLGQSLYFNYVSESYSQVLAQLTADVNSGHASQAQIMALASLPATDPNASNVLYWFSPAEAQALGFANAPTSSATSPDGYIGFSSVDAWNYTGDPNQTPDSTGTSDFIGIVEHEITEIMGRSSWIGGSGESSLIDLYRYEAAGTRALSPTDNPSYFSIDNGVTDLNNWNNYTIDSGDLGDWAENASGSYQADSFNDSSNEDIVNPFSATDATLMNVLGYDLTSAPTSPIPLSSTDITLSVGQLLEDLTLNQINPGSVNAPAGDSYVVVDTAFAIESITAAEITQALTLGVSEFIVGGAIAFLQGAADSSDNQIAALGNTPVVAALTVAEALADEANPPSSVPKAETVVVADTAANIEAMTGAEVAGLATISASHIEVSGLSGAGPLALEDGYTYLVDGAVTSGEAIIFADTGSTLTFDDTAAMAGTIYGFDSSDTIRLKDVAYDGSGSVNLVGGNVLDVNENGHTYTLQLDALQNFAGDFFHLAQDAHSGTDITENNTPCYCRGTRIKTLRGHKRVEKLKIGDRVRTMSGVARRIKWIGRRSFAGRFIRGRKDILPVCVKAGALGGDAPRRDLWISPLHAMYFERAYFDSTCFADGKGGAFDGVLIEAKELINGSSIVQAEHVDKVEYFHIELDTHDVIVAEGALSETFVDDDSRGMFHNADEFRALYPQARTAPAQYCAPRLNDGFEVAAVRRRIALRAGLVPSSDPRCLASLRGAIDEIGPRGVEGWALNAGAAQVPVCLDIYADGRLLGRTLANLHHADLAGSGRHGFSFTLPAGFVLAGATIEVRRSSDGARLSQAPCRRAAA